MREKISQCYILKYRGSFCAINHTQLVELTELKEQYSWVKLQGLHKEAFNA